MRSFLCDWSDELLAWSNVCRLYGGTFRSKKQAASWKNLNASSAKLKLSDHRGSSVLGLSAHKLHSYNLHYQSVVQFIALFIYQNSSFKVAWNEASSTLKHLETQGLDEGPDIQNVHCAKLCSDKCNNNTKTVEKYTFTIWWAFLSLLGGVS